MSSRQPTGSSISAPTAAPAAAAWSLWEGATSYLRTSLDDLKKFRSSKFTAAFARIECHYFINGAFFAEDGQLLRDVKRIRKIPGTIVQGRYDVVCPMRSAWDLSKAWPEAELRVVPDAGHSANEPGIAAELVRATDLYAGKSVRGAGSRRARGARARKG